LIIFEGKDVSGRRLNQPGMVAACGLRRIARKLHEESEFALWIYLPGGGCQTGCNQHRRNHETNRAHGSPFGWVVLEDHGIRTPSKQQKRAKESKPSLQG